MTNAFPEECPDCGTESAESSSMGIWCDPCGEWFDPEAGEAAGEAVTGIHGPAPATERDAALEAAEVNPGDASAQQAAETAVGGFVAASRSASHTQADRGAGQ